MISVQSPLRITVGLISAMFILSIADAAILEGLPIQKESFTVTEEEVTPDTNPTVPTNTTGGVARNQGPNVKDVLQNRGFTLADVHEKILLGDIIPSKEAALQSYVLLKNGDRAGLPSS